MEGVETGLLPALLSLGPSASADAVIGPESSSSELRACYAFASWLLEHPGEATAREPYGAPSPDFKVGSTSLRTVFCAPGAEWVSPLSKPGKGGHLPGPRLAYPLTSVLGPPGNNPHLAVGVPGGAVGAATTRRDRRAARRRPVPLGGAGAGALPMARVY